MIQKDDLARGEDESSCVCIQQYSVNGHLI